MLHLIFPYFFPLQLLQRFTAFYTETRKALKIQDFFDTALQHFTRLCEFKSRLAHHD